jgi:hypothetical protein
MRFSPVHILITCLVLECVVIATLLLIPKVLRYYLGVTAAAPARWQDRVELRYQHRETYAWMFARSKLRLDPMFRELPEFLRAIPSNVHIAMDIGCGHGVAACSLLEWFPELKLYAIDPNFHRVRAAAQALGDRARVFKAAAPDFESPAFPPHMDAAFALDMIHFLSDAELDLTLQRIRARLQDSAPLFLRAPMRPSGVGSFLWNLDRLTRALTGTPAYFRSVDQIRHAIENAGFQITRVQMSGDNHELFWFIASATLPKPVVQQDAPKQNHRDNVNHNQLEQMPVAEFIPPL